MHTRSMMITHPTRGVFTRGDAQGESRRWGRHPFLSLTPEREEHMLRRLETAPRDWLVGCILGVARAYLECTYTVIPTNPTHQPSLQSRRAHHRAASSINTVHKSLYGARSSVMTKSTPYLPPTYRHYGQATRS